MRKTTTYHKNKIEFIQELEAFIFKDEEVKNFNDLEYWAFKEFGFGTLLITKTLRLLEARSMISWNRETKKIIPLVKNNNPTNEGEKGGEDQFNKIVSASPVSPNSPGE